MGHPQLHVWPIVSDEPAVFAPSRTLVDLGVTPVAECLGSDLENRGDLPLGEKGLHVLAFPTSPRAVGHTGVVVMIVHVVPNHRATSAGTHEATRRSGCGGPHIP